MNKQRERDASSSTINLMRGCLAETVADIDVGRYYRTLAHDVCAYCGAPSEQTDHIDPTSRGGVNAWDNLTASCSACNGAKGDMTVLAFLAYRQTVVLLDALLEYRGRLRAVGPPRLGKRRTHSQVSRHRTVPLGGDSP